MIVPMSKVFILARQTDREQVLAALSELGMVHLVPVDPNRAVADEATTRQVDTLKQAMQALSGVKPQGSRPALSPLDAAREVLDIQRRAAEGRSRLATLYHQLEQIGIWDDMRLSHVEELRRANVDIRFYAMPVDRVEQTKADCVAVVGELPGRKLFVAVASYTSDPHIPDEAERLPLPSRDAPSIRAEAREIDDALHEDTRRLHVLATLVPAMRDELRALQQQVNETVALRGAADDPTIFAVQGWLPAENVGVLDERLSGRDIPIVIESMKPDEDEQPPTLVRPPAWARSIEGLFGVLGTVPGYREFDVSIPFLIALPIFTAMLISDGGYGALLLLGPALAYPWVSKQLGARFTQLLMIVGAVSLVWGILSNAFFGFKVLPFTLIPVDQTDASRQLMMNLSFTLGAIHLSIAQLWQAIRYFPNLQALSKLGWAIFVWGMYGVVRMFVLQDPLNWSTPWPYLLMAGATLAILFASPSRNLLKMLGLGLAQFPLSLLSAFSDVISYVRLMAVGVASSVLAVSFNDMAFEAGILPLTIVILIFGHGLNVGLAMIAMFAHGVRLNMLEFGNNLGMEWVGYAYKPFARITE